MSLKVLLADESPTIKKAFEIALKDYGVTIQSVHQGIDVTELCQSFKPDICFIDALIPKLSGYEASTQIKDNVNTSNTPTVIMWSGFMDLDEEKFESSKADGSIEKPFETKQLRELVQKLVPTLQTNEISKHLIPDTIPTNEVFGSEIPSFDESKAPSLNDNEVTGDYGLDELESAAGDFSVESLGDVSKPAPEIESDSAGFDGLEGLDDFKVQTLDSPDTDDIFGGVSAAAKSSQDSNNIEDIFSSSKNENSIPPPPVNFDLGGTDNDSDSNVHSIDEGSSDLELNLPPLEDDLPLETLPPDLEGSAMIGNELSDSTTPPPAPVEVVAPSVATSTNHISDGNENEPSGDKLFQVSDQDNIPKLSKDELKRLILAQSKDIIESVVWDVVPELARELIQKEITKLMGKTEKDNLDGDLR